MQYERLDDESVWQFGSVKADLLHLHRVHAPPRPKLREDVVLQDRIRLQVRTGYVLMDLLRILVVDGEYRWSVLLLSVWLSVSLVKTRRCLSVAS